jgi:phosphate transport system substrate-binding protein
MKKISSLSLVIAVFSSIFFSSCNQNKEPSGRNSNGEMHGKISFSGAFALYPLAVQWGEEYKKLHPGVTFDIQGGGAGKGMTDALSGTVDIGMVSRAINAEEEKKGAYAIAVAKDAVVPTINANNPWIAEILKRGMTRTQFKGIWVESKVLTWGDVIGTKAPEKIEVYTRSDAAGAPETWAKYLGSKQEDLLGTGVFGDPGVAEVVSKTKLAIGFNQTRNRF